jgi:uncharacterized protein
MSDEHPNVTRVRSLFDKVGGGDLDGALDCYTADAVYRVGGDNLVSGNYKGRDAMRAFFFKLYEVTGGTMQISIDDVVGDDGHAVAFWALTAEREGKSLDANGIMAFKVDDEGKFTESWFLYNDQRAYDDFYS